MDQVILGMNPDQAARITGMILGRRLKSSWKSKSIKPANLIYSYSDDESFLYFVFRNVKDDLDNNPEQLLINFIFMSVQFLKHFEK